MNITITSLEANHITP